MNIETNYESGSVGGGAAIDSPVVDTASAERVMVLVTAGGAAGSADRALTVKFLAADGTSVLHSVAVTIVKGTTGAVLVDPRGTIQAGTTLIPLDPGAKMQASLAAAGNQPAQLALYAR